MMKKLVDERIELFNDIKEDVITNPWTHVCAPSIVQDYLLEVVKFADNVARETCESWREKSPNGVLAQLKGLSQTIKVYTMATPLKKGTQSKVNNIYNIYMVDETI
jgi:hypothetical protein